MRKTFPQMRAYQIKEFPVPDASINEQEELGKLVKEILDLTENEADSSEIEVINNSIDEYVMNLYHLTEEEKDVVRNFKVSK